MHPRWFEIYPQGLVNLSDPDNDWFRDHPHWFEGYHIPKFSHGDGVRMSLDRQMLCFKHAVYPDPHILTCLDIFACGYKIGTYYLATRLD